MSPPPATARAEVQARLSLPAHTLLSGCSPATQAVSYPSVSPRCAGETAASGRNCAGSPPALLGRTARPGVGAPSARGRRPWEAGWWGRRYSPPWGRTVSVTSPEPRIHPCAPWSRPACPRALPRSAGAEAGLSLGIQEALIGLVRRKPTERIGGRGEAKTQKTTENKA